MGPYDATLVRLIGSLGVGRLGFEAANVTVSRHRLARGDVRRDAPARRQHSSRPSSWSSAFASQGRGRNRRRFGRRREPAVGSGSRRVRGNRAWPDRARRRAGHRQPDPARRIRAAGVRHDRRERTERGAAARDARRAKIKRKRPRRAGLRWGLRLILRRPHPDGFGRPGGGAGPGSLRGGARSPRSGDSNGRAGTVAVRHRRGGSGLADHPWIGRGVRSRNGTRPRDRYPRGPSHHPAGAGRSR